MRSDRPPGLLAGVPAYFYPWPGDARWDRVAALPPGTVLVVDPADGPGAAQDPHYVTAVGQARRAGCVLLGYVDTAYAAREPDEVLGDAQLHRRWYGVDGWFLDRAALSPTHLDYYADLCERLRGDGARVALNPGQPLVDPRCFDLADHVVVFEGTEAQHRVAPFPGWLRDLPREQVWHLVHGVRTESGLRDVVQRARRTNAGLLYVTDRGGPNPWDGLPTYLDTELALLGAGSGGSAGDPPGVQ